MAANIHYVLLPGLHGSEELWHPFLEAAPRAASLSPTSYPPDAQADYSTLEAYVRSKLPPSAPFALVAESFSGPIGIRIAASPPVNMSALVLCNSFATPPACPAWAWFPWKPLFRIPGPSQIIRRYFVGRDAPASRVQQVRDLVLRTDPSALAARVRLVLGVDVRGSLSQILLPVLYLRGTEDRLVADRSLAVIRELLPSVVVSFIPAPHFTLQIAPALAWHAIQRFAEQWSEA